MNRKLFLKNALMAIAISLVPKILQPATPELEEMEEVQINVVWYNSSTGEYKQLPSSSFKIKIKKEYAEKLKNIQA